MISMFEQIENINVYITSSRTVTVTVCCIFFWKRQPVKHIYLCICTNVMGFKPSFIVVNKITKASEQF